MNESTFVPWVCYNLIGGWHLSRQWELVGKTLMIRMGKV